MAPEDDVDSDPIVKALERSTIAQTLKAARASLAQPSRPFTPLDRSLFQLPDGGGSSRPTSGYSIDQLSFYRDTYGHGGGRPDSARTPKPETILEEDGYRREGDADVFRLDNEWEGDDSPRRRPSPQDSDAAVSSGSEELTPMVPATAGDASPTTPHRATARPPRPGGSGYPSANNMVLQTAGGYPLAASDGTHRKSHRSSSPWRQRSADGQPRRRKSSRSPAPAAREGEAGAVRASSSSRPDTARHEWDAACEAIITKLHEFTVSKGKIKKDAELILQMCEHIWNLVIDIKDAKGTRSREYAPMLLREVMALMDLKDLKDVKCVFKLSRSALSLLLVESATQGVHDPGIQAAYMNIAQVLFKYSQKEGCDGEFLAEGLIEPLLEVLQSNAPACISNDLRVYVVGTLKNVSHDDANQKRIVSCGAVAILFRLMGSQQLSGSSKEAQLLIQITATLRNLASQHYKQFLQEERLDSLTRIMALFPGHVELLTNISRIHAKLTLHNSACEVFSRNDVHIKQVVRTLQANVDVPPLALRLAFVLGNLTERSDRLRVIFAFDCGGTELVPTLLGKYWQKERQLARIEVEKSQSMATGMQEIEEVLVKLVRLLANIAISASVGTTLASSSAAVDPLLDMLGAKRIGDSEELVLNVVATITNLLFYDVPSNLFFQEENKQLLCRLFRPLLLESYNIEALIETTRALGNISRHADARRCMVELRLDEILVILLGHDSRDLVFYVCGALVNLGSDPDCTVRLVGSCPAVQKLGTVLTDAPLDDPALQLVAVKVLTNLSLDPGVEWAPPDVKAIREVLEQALVDNASVGVEISSRAEHDAAGARQQLLDLARQLLDRLPQQPDDPPRKGVPQDRGQSVAGKEFMCPAQGCGRRFHSEEKLAAHMERRHCGPC
mmetsp:Transcript_29641/g.83577  ORF Transcript_29641/g.83577 Transcript_29641/m.83577 type:complete len:902 (-) Transcript_29641:164-2869(-)